MAHTDYIKGFKVGVERGKQEGFIEAQKLNTNTDLPSNETLFKIFQLLFTCQEEDRKTCSCYMNAYEHYANYITKNWYKNN